MTKSTTINVLEPPELVLFPPFPMLDPLSCASIVEFSL